MQCVVNVKERKRGLFFVNLCLFTGWYNASTILSTFSCTHSEVCGFCLILRVWKSLFGKYYKKGGLCCSSKNCNYKSRFIFYRFQSFESGFFFTCSWKFYYSKAWVHVILSHTSILFENFIVMQIISLDCEMAIKSHESWHNYDLWESTFFFSFSFLFGTLLKYRKSLSV